MKKEDLKHLAKLSKIRLTQEELDLFAPQMATILESVKTLDEVDISKVKVKSLRKVKLSDLRDDAILPSMPQADALSNAPFVQDGYIKVFGALIEESGA